MHRFYYQISTKKWLFRIDGNSPLTLAKATASAAESFGIPLDDIQVVDTERLTEIDATALRLAKDWTGEPPGPPAPSRVVTDKRIAPPLPVPTRRAVLERIISSESATLQELQEFIKMDRGL